MTRNGILPTSDPIELIVAALAGWSTTFSEDTSVASSAMGRRALARPQQSWGKPLRQYASVEKRALRFSEICPTFDALG